jgi:hypothetical protein
VREAIVKSAVETFVWGIENEFPDQVPEIVERLRAMADLAEEDWKRAPKK